MTTVFQSLKSAQDNLFASLNSLVISKISGEIELQNKDGLISDPDNFEGGFKTVWGISTNGTQCFIHLVDDWDMDNQDKYEFNKFNFYDVLEVIEDVFKQENIEL